MSLTVSGELLKATSSAQLAKYRKSAKESRIDREMLVNTNELGDEGLKDLEVAAQEVGDKKTARAVESIRAARGGNFDKPVSSFKAFRDVLESFLLANSIDGWIYVCGDDGKLYPELVTGVSFDDGLGYGRGKGDPSIKLHTTSYGFSRDGNYKVQFGLASAAHTFSPRNVSNRRVADILAEAGLFKETSQLRDDYQATMARHRDVAMDAFAKQFRVNGRVFHFEHDNHLRRGESMSGRKVIHDLEPSAYAPAVREAESFIFEKSGSGFGVVPEQAVVKVFDLKTHEFFWVNSDHLEPYAYDKTMGEKMVLPSTHRDLLDCLTSDLDAFVDDFVEGKIAGNLVLCKGIPGVGKTLTAEVYAELIERPLYSIHTGTLGTTADQIEKGLRIAFHRAKRWDCVLLLDEADVFVVQRGIDLEQNAIVAEFLRVLEYFDGLMFMTTNRPDDIDDAVVSRCAAVIEYSPPGPVHAASIWRVMANQFRVDLGGDLIEQLVDLFPKLPPRDIKMLLRLVLRMCRRKNWSLTLDVFRTCAMFRAIKMKEA